MDGTGIADAKILYKAGVNGEWQVSGTTVVAVQMARHRV